jgi:NADH-quinone oxidoreductase subunit J
VAHRVGAPTFLTPKAEMMKDTVPSDFGGIDAFGRILFNQALVPFELSSALLMVAVVGAIAVARGKQPDKLGEKTEGGGS